MRQRSALVHVLRLIANDPNVRGHFLRCLLIAATILLTVVEAAGQTTNTWIFDADGVWHNSTNWSPNTIPNLTNSSAILWGGITADHTIRYDSNVKLGSLSISNSANYTLSGFGTLTFDNFGSSVPAVLNNYGGGSAEITSLISLLENITIQQSGSGTLKLSGDLGGSVAKSVTKTGSGNLEITGVGTFGGGLFINGGNVLAYAEQSLGNGTNITLNGGTLTYGPNVVSDNSRSYVVTNSGTFNISNNFTFAVTNDGRLRGSGSITKTGGGTLKLTGDNSAGLSNAVFTINGGSILIGAENNLGALNNDVIIAGGTLLVSQGFTASSGKVFTMSGAGGTLDIDENQSLILGTDGQLAGSADLIKAGLGVLTLSGNNSASFTGNISVNDGTVRVTAENNLGAAASDVTLNGGTLNIGGTFTANGSKLINVGTGGGTLDIDSGSTFTLGTAGQLTGSTTLTKEGAGILGVQGDMSSSQSGMTVINNGSVVFSGANGVSGTGGFTVNAGGTLSFDNGSALNTNRTASALTLNGGVLKFLGNSANTMEALGALTIGSGASTLQVQRGGNVSNNLYLASLTRASADATINFMNSGSGTLGTAATGNPKIIFTGAAPALTNSILGGWATALGTVGGNLEFASLNGTALNNLLALGTWETRAQNQWGVTDNAKPGGDQTLGSARSVYSLTLANTRDVNLSGNALTIVSGGLIAQGASVISSSTAGGYLTSGASGVGSPLYAHVSTNGQLTISAAITDNGSGVVSLVKANDGKLILSGTNSYSGNTFINGGLLQVGSSSAIPDSSAVSIAYGGIFNLTNFSQTVGSIEGRGTILLGSGTLTAGGDATSTDFSGGISGTGGLIKTGSGTLTLSGTNFYTGNTIINGGTVSVSRESNLGAAANDIVFGGGTVDFTGTFAANTAKVLNFSSAGAVNVVSNKTVTFTQPDQLVGTGDLTKSGAGTLIIGGASNYTGNLIINEGELRVAGTALNVDSFLSLSRVTNATGAGGTLTWAYHNENFTNTISAATGASGTNIYLGFDVVGTTNTWYVHNGTNLTWAGLIINGGNVQPVTNTVFATANSSLQLNGGNYYVGGGNPTGGKTVEFKGDIYLRGGTLQGAPGGGSHGTIYTHGDIHSLGTILVNGPSIIMAVDNGTTTHVIDGTTPLNGVTDLTKQGPGTVRIDQQIGVGTIYVNQGTLLLGANNRVNDGANIIMQNATLSTGGYKETIGTLTLNNNAIIDMGTGSSASYLAFANSSGNGWSSYSLTISNYLDSAEAIYFGTTTSGLTTNQLSNVQWQDPYGSGSGLVLGAIIESDGRIRPAPIPEFTSILGFAMLGCIFTLKALVGKFRKSSCAHVA